ncbi:unnamed protein product [Urochloa humidicola]
MEMILSAVLGELTSRSINFIINKFSKPPTLTVDDSLQRAVIRAQIIIDEATGRPITNQAMLLQLNMLREAMHRGHYVLDTFRYQPHDEDSTKDQSVSCSSSVAKVNSAIHLSCSSGGAEDFKEVKETLDKLRSMILDVDELIVFLMNYPRMYCQPYSMHIQIANCMFGRQMESQLIIDFLLRVQPHGDEELEVLPIVGSSKVGKSTLVAHVCKDEKVTNHFSEILLLQNHGFTDDELATFIEEFVIKYQNHVPNLHKDGRLLVVVELVGDLNEDAWNRLYSACKQCVLSGSKIIVTSRSNNIAKFGTTRPLTLKHLSHEAHWYFFKTLVFGSMDPNSYPRLTNLAMEIARTQRSSLCCANVIARLLNENFDVHFWRKVLAFLRGSYQKHVSRFGVHPFDSLDQNTPAHLERMATPAEDFVLYHQDQRFSDEEVSDIKLEDVMYGNVKPHGKFEALLWRSTIPPYYSYVFTCEIQELKATSAKRKRPMKHEVTVC